MTKFIKNNQSFGFGIVGIIIVIAAVAVLGGFFGYQYLKLQNIQEGAKTPAVESPVTPSAQIQPQTEEINTTDWKIYRNEKYGFEIKYPNNFVLEEPHSSPENDTEEFKLFNYRIYTQEGDVRGLPIPNFLLTIDPNIPFGPAEFSQQSGSPVSIIILGINQFEKVGPVIYFLKGGKQGYFQFYHRGETGNQEVKNHSGFIDDTTQGKVLKSILSTFKFIK